jgi:hypothetical protein
MLDVDRLEKEKKKKKKKRKYSIRLELHRQAPVQRRKRICYTPRDGEESTPLQKHRQLVLLEYVEINDVTAAAAMRVGRKLENKRKKERASSSRCIERP